MRCVFVFNFFFLFFCRAFTGRCEPLGARVHQPFQDAANLLPGHHRGVRKAVRLPARPAAHLRDRQLGLHEAHPGERISGSYNTQNNGTVLTALYACCRRPAWPREHENGHAARAAVFAVKTLESRGRGGRSLENWRFFPAQKLCEHRHLIYTAIFYFLRWLVGRDWMGPSVFA